MQIYRNLKMTVDGDGGWMRQGWDPRHMLPPIHLFQKGEKKGVRGPHLTAASPILAVSGTQSWDVIFSGNLFPHPLFPVPSRRALIPRLAKSRRLFLISPPQPLGSSAISPIIRSGVVSTVG